MLRRIATRSRTWLRQNIVHWERRCGWVKKGNWESGLLKDELSFWERALADGGQNWDPSEYRERTDPELALQDELKKLIEPCSQSVVRILDVGSGPLTRVGRKWPGHELQITATDPLAEHYKAVLKKLGISAPVLPIPAEGERLLDYFAPNHFDLAYASNSLDHSYDPLRVIAQMLAVVKPDRYVYLWHFANCGKGECYAGLHQWNFDIHKDDFMISDGQRTSGLRAHFGSAIDLACERQRAFNSEVVVAKLKKMATPPA